MLGKRQHIVVGKHLLCAGGVVRYGFLHPWPVRVTRMINSFNLYCGNHTHQWRGKLVVNALFPEQISS